MRCPEEACGAERTRVYDSREVGGGAFVWRRRECPSGHRFTTFEATAGATLRNRAEALDRIIAVLRKARKAAAGGQWLDDDDEALLAEVLGVTR